MSPETSPVIEKIIAATIECLNQTGLESLTIRTIAKQAGVNSAAINYYFGSKDKLVEKALKRAMAEMSAMPSEILGDKSLEPGARLRVLFESLIEGILLYPGIVKAEIYAPLMRGEEDAPFLTQFTAFLKETGERISDLGLRPLEGDLPTVLLQMTSAVLFAAIMPGLSRNLTGQDLNNPQTRNAYVSLLYSRYFG